MRIGADVDRQADVSVWPACFSALRAIEVRQKVGSHAGMIHPQAPRQHDEIDPGVMIAPIGVATRRHLAPHRQNLADRVDRQRIGEVRQAKGGRRPVLRHGNGIGTNPHCRQDAAMAGSPHVQSVQRHHQPGGDPPVDPGDARPLRLQRAVARRLSQLRRPPWCASTRPASARSRRCNGACRRRRPTSRAPTAA